MNELARERSRTTWNAGTYAYSCLQKTSNTAQYAYGRLSNHITASPLNGTKTLKTIVEYNGVVMAITVAVLPGLSTDVSHSFLFISILVNITFKMNLQVSLIFFWGWFKAPKIVNYKYQARMSLCVTFTKHIFLGYHNGSNVFLPRITSSGIVFSAVGKDDCRALGWGPNSGSIATAEAEEEDRNVFRLWYWQTSCPTAPWHTGSSINFFVMPISNSSGEYSCRLVGCGFRPSAPGQVATALVRLSRKQLIICNIRWMF